MKRQLAILSLVLMALGLPITPAAAESPRAYVQGILDKTMAIQNDPSLDANARSRAIHAIIGRSFDFPMMAKDTLGSAYGQISTRLNGRNLPVPSVTCSRLPTPAWC